MSRVRSASLPAAGCFGYDAVLAFGAPGLRPPSASARFRAWTTRTGTFVIATQLPETEYTGPSITDAAEFAVRAMVQRFGRNLTYVEHYNRASYGLEICDPTFNRIEFVASANAGRRAAAPEIEIAIVGRPAMTVQEIAQATGLAESTVWAL